MSQKSLLRDIQTGGVPVIDFETIINSDSGARGRGFDTYLRRVVSLSKDRFTPPKSAVNTQEAVAPSQHD